MEENTVLLIVVMVLNVKSAEVVTRIGKGLLKQKRVDYFLDAS